MTFTTLIWYGKFSLKKSGISHFGGRDQDKNGSFSHFFNFNSCPKSCSHIPENLNFLDILGKNLVIFYNFSRFMSEKIDSFYQNMFQLMCEKNNFFKFHTF